jgi:hypothetical protein
MKLESKTTDEIHLFAQFYIDPNPIRQKEIVTCLHKNIQNPYITKIHLLNERIYKNKEIEAKSCKLIQTDIGKRLMYSDIFKYVREQNIQGYIIIANSDILFDATLENLRYTDIHLSKKMYAQLRFEYNPFDIKLSSIFGPHFCSQDTWILHTNFGIDIHTEKLFKFHMGKPGCDNKLIYLFCIMGYEVLNDPQFIKTYHYHSSLKRNYTQKDTISYPWGTIIPYGYSIQEVPKDLFPKTNTWYSEMMERKTPEYNDNTFLYEYIVSKLANSEHFVIPRIAGVENNYAWQGNTILKTSQVTQEQMDYFGKTIKTLQHNAGILVSNIPEIVEYSQEYLKAFDNCDLYTGWDKSSGVYPYISDSHDFIAETYKQKKIAWAFALDIFHYIYATPWTHALRRKRILVISPFEESIREKIPIREKLYDGVDLFPECSFVFIKPPQTQGETEQTEYFGFHLREFKKELDAIKDTYDVALVSCGGYGNLVCNHIFESGKSAIYIGGVLQMYFGILGMRWYRERPDIVRLFLNEHWIRPKESEKPANYKHIEGSCYW